MKARRVAWGIWGLTVALLAVWPFLGAAAGRLTEELVFYIVVPIAVVSYATVGALITSRHHENRIGLILASVALAFAVALTAGDYATLAVRRPESLPFARWVAWLGRLAAVYYCCLEALQNVTKYAEAHTVTVLLADANGGLTFEVSDDGIGFDAGSTSSGTGLQGMADRVEAVGGTLEIESSLGVGTIVSGHIPTPSTGASG